jgi:hypothetical protein
MTSDEISIFSWSIENNDRHSNRPEKPGPRQLTAIVGFPKVDHNVEKTGMGYPANGCPQIGACFAVNERVVFFPSALAHVRQLIVIGSPLPSLSSLSLHEALRLSINGVAYCHPAARKVVRGNRYQ